MSMKAPEGLGSPEQIFETIDPVMELYSYAKLALTRPEDLYLSGVKATQRVNQKAVIVPAGVVGRIAFSDELRDALKRDLRTDELVAPLTITTALGAGIQTMYTFVLPEQVRPESGFGSDYLGPALQSIGLDIDCDSVVCLQREHSPEYGRTLVSLASAEQLLDLKGELMGYLPGFPNAA